MTREQAIKLAEGAVGNRLDASKFVAVSVALGMLKLDEPKSARDRFVDAMKAQLYSIHSTGMNDALRAFDASQKDSAS